MKLNNILEFIFPYHLQANNSKYNDGGKIGLSNLGNTVSKVYFCWNRQHVRICLVVCVFVHVSVCVCFPNIYKIYIMFSQADISVILICLVLYFEKENFIKQMYIVLSCRIK